jgi:hypothetical protein
MSRPQHTAEACRHDGSQLKYYIHRYSDEDVLASFRRIRKCNHARPDRVMWHAGLLRWSAFEATLILKLQTMFEANYHQTIESTDALTQGLTCAVAMQAVALAHESQLIDHE